MYLLPQRMPGGLIGTYKLECSDDGRSYWCWEEHTNECINLGCRQYGTRRRDKGDLGEVAFDV